MYKRKTELDIENKLKVTEGGWKRRRKLGVCHQQVYTTVYKMDKQQGPAVPYRERYPVSYNDL